MISFKVLGKPGRDNALFVWINSGTAFHKLLFDCGEGIFKGISQSDIKSVEHLFFSHLHIDHIAGFDYLFRRNYERRDPMYVWGPEKTIEIIQNRLKGYMWNLINEEACKWHLKDIHKDNIRSAVLGPSDAYKSLREKSSRNFLDTIIENKDYKIDVILLNHETVSAAYKISEPEQLNIDKDALSRLSLKPGAWLEQLKDFSIKDDKYLIIEGTKYFIGELRKKLLIKSKGMSLAYMTDFVLDNKSFELISSFLNGCDTLICESQYLSSDIEHAKRNYHLTSKEAAAVAQGGCVNNLFLFHVSDRYNSEDYKLMLSQAKEIFPNTFFPWEWEIS